MKKEKKEGKNRKEKKPGVDFFWSWWKTHVL